MIIKIDFLNKGSKYIDGAEEVIVEGGFETPKEILDKYSPPQYHLITGGNDNWNYRYISYKDKNNDLRCIITKYQLFVMNNNGKTIEIYKPIEIKQTEVRKNISK